MFGFTDGGIIPARRTIMGAGVATCIAALAGVAATTGTTAGLDSGLRGRVLYGPTCPVERVGQNCTRPYQATIRIRRLPGRRLVAVARSAADGSFSVRLAAGRYLLEPQNGRPFPTSAPRTVTVYAHRYANVTISYDSGIR
jgi:hypothetical protein